MLDNVSRTLSATMMCQCCPTKNWIFVEFALAVIALQEFFCLADDENRRGEAGQKDKVFKS